jgi:hypothetical protein
VGRGNTWDDADLMGGKRRGVGGALVARLHGAREGNWRRRAAMVADGAAAWLEERYDRGDGLGPKDNRAR